MASTSTAARGLGSYVRHRPEETVLYGLVREYAEPFVAHAREASGRGLPAYVAEAFRAYLRCGVLAHGFARAYWGTGAPGGARAGRCKGSVRLEFTELTKDSVGEAVRRGARRAGLRG